MEEDASKDSEDDEPSDKEDEVPGESSVGLEELELAADEGKSAEGSKDDEENSGGGREASDDESEVPFW